jgi:enamine deaminase RidA (YjgF/YER057c/UK114 family)
VQRKVYGAADTELPARMSQIVEAGGLAFLSGVLGVDAAGEPIVSARSLSRAARAKATGKLVRNVAALQCLACIDQLKSQLASAGRDLSSIVHLSVYVQDMDSFKIVETLLAKACGKQRPAIIALEVPRPGPVAGVRVAITAIAWFGEGKPEAN